MRQRRMAILEGWRPTKMKNVQEIINGLKANRFSNQELERYLESPLVLVKVNAILAILRNRITEKKIIDKLNDISENIQQEPKVIGEWTTWHYAMATLYLLGVKDMQELHDNSGKPDEYDQGSIRKLIEQIPVMLEEGF